MKLNNKNIITFAIIFMCMWCTHTAIAHPNNEFFSPDPIIVGELEFVCQYETVTYSADNIAAGASIEWEVSDGTIVQDNGETIIIEWGEMSPGTIVLTTTSADGSCTTSNQQTVSIRAPQVFSLDALDIAPGTFICDGDTAFFSAAAVYEQFPVDESEITYQWFVNGIPSGTNSPDFEFTNIVDGDEVHCEATSTFNCLANDTAVSNSVTISIIPSPIVSTFIIVDPGNPICPGDTVDFSAITMPQTPLPDYEWQVNGVTVSNFPTHSETGLVAGDVVICTALSGNGCALNNPASDTIVIEETTPFPATISIETDMNPACAGELVIFETILTNEGDAPTFQWFVNGVPALNQTSDQFGLYTFADGDVISCEMMSSSNCASNTVAFSNEVTLLLGGSFTTNVTLDAPNPFCIGTGDVTFTAIVDNPAPNPMFTWEINGAASITTSTNEIPLTIEDGDLVTVTYTADFGDCYTAGDTTDMLAMDGVNIVSPSIVLVVDDDEICRGESMTFTPMPTGEGDSPEYQWFIDGIAFGGNMDSYTTDTINDFDVISVQMTTSLLCADSPTVTSNGIQVRVSDVTAEFMSIIPGCNSLGTIEATASGGISNTYTYDWSNGESGNMIDSLDTGTYTVTVTDEAGCTDIISADIDATDAPEILDGTTTIASCGFEDGTITVDFIGGMPPYTFLWMDGMGDEVSMDSLQLTAGTDSFTVLITDANGCYDSADYFIDEIPPVNVVAPEDVAIDLGDSIRIVAYAETLDTVSYEWSPEMGVGCLDCPITYLSPYETTTYTLTMTQSGGCMSTDQITVTVNENSRVFIPNIFSPNNDGVNDVFVINTGPGVAQIRSFRVYDRWGSLVYNVENAPTNRESSGWDGTFNGRTRSQDVYVYFVELELLNGRVIDFSGDVTLVR